MAMRTLFGLGSTAALTLALAVATACSGGGPESTIDAGGNSTGGSVDPSRGGTSGGGLALGLGGSNPGASGAASGTSGGGPVQECAAANQQAELAPVYLVFLLDESGSMGDGQHGDRAQKWDPVTAALKAFFADPESTGITASLSVFPLDQNKTTGPAVSDLPAACAASAYATPIVAPAALPNATAFAGAITALDPPNEFGTPTLPALSGTIEYARSLRSEDATRKVAIVMVTDGEPVSCQGNTVQSTADAARAVAGEIPTYVIGVGASLQSLNSIAEGGGTERAFIVSLDDPEQTRTQLLDAIKLIRGEAISCDIAVPSPPAGKKLDPNKVNVEFTASGQGPVSLKYGVGCEGDTSWRYDDPAAPKSIQLCPDTCSKVKADANSKLDVVFGCVDRPDVVQ
jgi:hypothetical protein